MDILSLQRKNGFFEIEVRINPKSDPTYFVFCRANVILHLKAKYDKRRFNDGTVVDQIWDVKDFSGAARRFIWGPHLDAIRQSINSYIINHKDKEL